jgi:hypothetical protein
VSISNRVRRVGNNQTVLDQVDLFQGDGFSRALGLTIADVTSVVFFNNVVQPWVFTDGVAVTDRLVRAGSIYFHEISGTPGYYSLRLRPDAVGYWRVVLTYAAGQQIVAQDYDVNAEIRPISGGLTSSFTNC